MPAGTGRSGGTSPVRWAGVAGDVFKVFSQVLQRLVEQVFGDSLHGHYFYEPVAATLCPGVLRQSTVTLGRIS